MCRYEEAFSGTEGCCGVAQNEAKEKEQQQ
jgi:hypothetical protein